MPFAVFRLVVEDGRLDFHLSRRVIALKVRGVIHRIPKTPFGCGKNFQRFFFARRVCQRQLLDFASIAPRHKAEQFGANAVLLRGKESIAQSVPAFVKVKFRLCGQKGGRKERFSVCNIKTSPSAVRRYIVVAVARDPPEFCVFVKIISAARVGNQPEKVLVAKVIDPRQRGKGRLDHILFALVVKMSEFHICFPVVFLFIVTKKRFTVNMRERTG